jgi:hypothetical protein
MTTLLKYGAEASTKLNRVLLNGATHATRSDVLRIKIRDKAIQFIEF